MDHVNCSSLEPYGAADGGISGSKVMLCLMLSILAVATTIINSLVITAILVTRKLHQPANYLICSLAVTDLLVAALVMPVGIVYIVEEEWVLGQAVCHLWLGLDVTCCTCSILHLAAIAHDRYRAITDAVAYSQKRTSQRAFITITALWVISVLVSLPPLVWRKHPDASEDVAVMHCLIEHDHVAFTVYSTFGAFYIPLVLILVLYYKIYRVAQTLRIRRGSSRLTQQTVNSVVLSSEREVPPLSPDTLSPTEKSFSDPSTDCERVRIAPTTGRVFRSRRNPAARERRAALTLGLILGAFVICWLPFFLKEVIMNTCSSCNTPAFLADLLTWLGYLNSFINPLIYTIFNEDFKKAFKKLLPCCCTQYS